MAENITELKTDYKDDVLVTGQQRKYNLIQNSDGTVSLVDVSSYAQYGDTLKAEYFNATNAAVNALNGKTDLTNQMLCDGRISFKWEADSSSGIFYTNIYVDNLKVASLAQGFVSSS